MITVTLYRRNNCEPCDKVESDLTELRETIPHQVIIVDLDTDPNYQKGGFYSAPVVEVGPYRLKSPISKQDLQAALGAASDRRQSLEKVGDEEYQKRLERGHTITRADRFSLWLSSHYMALFNLIIFLYAGLPFLAPVFMNVGAQLPAKVIYTIYSPLCHQFAFRSWFLFGEQLVYPRELAGVQGVMSYEKATGLDPLDIEQARSFIGNETLGYKVALCERDTAIYGAILLFGIIFAVTGRRLKPIPLYLWIIIGVLPIAIDGVSQLPGLNNLMTINWLPARESTPMLRALTGFIFGFTTAWYGYPYVEETMEETRRILSRKEVIVGMDKE